jgi:hypothetical protein
MPIRVVLILKKNHLLSHNFLRIELSLFSAKWPIPIRLAGRMNTDLVTTKETKKKDLGFLLLWFFDPQHIPLLFISGGLGVFVLFVSFVVNQFLFS